MPLGYLSGDTTVYSGVSLAGGLVVPSLSLATYGFSIQTAAAATSIANNSLGLVFRASGISLVYVSEGTVYSFGSNGVGASFTSGTA